MPLRNHLLLVLPWLLFTAHVIKQEKSSNVRPAKDLALFFAVSKYDQWDKLQNPVKDAEAIAGDLNKYYAFDTLVVRNPNQPELTPYTLAASSFNSSPVTSFLLSTILPPSGACTR